jgi:hypothetical protein
MIDDTSAEAGENTFDLMQTLDILDPETVAIERAPAAGLHLTIKDRGEWQNVNVEPCYPLTLPGRFLAFRDEGEEEIGILENIDELDPDSKGALADELAKQHFIPVITQVNDIGREFHIPVWQVETDRGPRRLELKARHDARRLPGRRIYVRDADGNGYLIPDVRKLDEASQALIELNV